MTDTDCTKKNMFRIFMANAVVITTVTTSIGMATIVTLCALFVLLIVMMAFCLGYRRKKPILRETLTTS